MKPRKSLSPYSSFRDDRKARSSSKSVQIAHSLVKVLNPDDLPYFELEEMRCILDRAPINSKDKIQKIFHSFIFQQKSFKMPVSAFITEFEKLMRDAKPATGRSRENSNSSKVNRSFRDGLELRHSSSRHNISVNQVPNKIQKRVRKLSKERLYITYDQDADLSAIQDQDQSWVSQESTTFYRSPSHRRFSSDVVKLTPENPKKYKLDVSKASISRENSISPYLDQRETALPSDATTPTRFEKLRKESGTPVLSRPRYENLDKLIEVRRRHLKQSQISYNLSKK